MLVVIKYVWQSRLLKWNYYSEQKFLQLLTVNIKVFSLKIIHRALPKINKPCIQFDDEDGQRILLAFYQVLSFRIHLMDMEVETTSMFLICVPFLFQCVHPN